MAPRPVIFACSNPDPEIDPAAKAVRDDLIIGTGRSDYPNQVNNVLFPVHFPWQLDARAARSGGMVPHAWTSAEGGRWYMEARQGDLIIGANGENLSPDLIEQRLALQAGTASCVLGMELEGDERPVLIADGCGRLCKSQSLRCGL